MYENVFGEKKIVRNRIFIKKYVYFYKNYCI